MIKRKYFMSVKKIHGDGNGSYSFNQAIAEYISWLPDAGKVYNDSFEHHKEEMAGKPGTVHEVTSFCRVQ